MKNVEGPTGFGVLLVMFAMAAMVLTGVWMVSGLLDWIFGW